MAKGNPNSPARQAAAAAGAAVPTRKSINSQYGQSIGDVEGFSKALLGLLQQGGGVGSGYNQAITQQAGIDNAARAALAGTGTPYAAGSAAASAGMGASALSALNAKGAAANTYGATLPHAAAARGQFGVQSLENARQQALTQRNQSYQQAYLEALQQARTNAFNQRIAMGQLNLQRGQFRFQQTQAAQDNAYRYAALQQNQNQFKSSQAQQWQEYLRGLQAKVAAGTASGLQGYSRSDIQSWEKQGGGVANTAILHGLPIKQAIAQMVQQGVPKQIALVQAQLQYGMATRPTKDEFTHGAGTTSATFNKNGYQAALKAYQTVTRSLAAWVNQRQYRQTIKQQRSQGTAPGQGRGIG